MLETIGKVSEAMSFGQLIEERREEWSLDGSG
jgi:hypothetical protein